jgi:hypothetical protein
MHASAHGNTGRLQLGVVRRVQAHVHTGDGERLGKCGGVLEDPAAATGLHEMDGSDISVRGDGHVADPTLARSQPTTGRHARSQEGTGRRSTRARSRRRRSSTSTIIRATASANSVGESAAMTPARAARGADRAE